MQQFVDEAGLKVFAQEALQAVNTRIGERIVSSISADSDDLHTPSAKAVFDLVSSINTEGKSYVTVTGSIESVEDPDPSKIYLQRDDETDTTWQQYIWAEDTWVPIGTTELALEPVSNEAIKTMFDEVFESTAPDLGDTAEDETV